LLGAGIVGKNRESKGAGEAEGGGSIRKPYGKTPRYGVLPGRRKRQMRTKGVEGGPTQVDSRKDRWGEKVLRR